MYVNQVEIFPYSWEIHNEIFRDKEAWHIQFTHKQFFKKSLLRKGNQQMGQNGVRRVFSTILTTMKSEIITKFKSPPPKVVIEQYVQNEHLFVRQQLRTKLSQSNLIKIKLLIYYSIFW